MRMNDESRLRALLYLFGVSTVIAAFAIILPTDWRVRTHEWLGLGPFPHAPLTQYLTRSIAGLYAMHGGFILLAAGDVRRYAPFVTYAAMVDAVFGLVVIGIDLYAGMPWYWTALEGPSVFVASVLMLVLQSRLHRADNSQDLIPTTQVHS